MCLGEFDRVRGNGSGLVLWTGLVFYLTGGLGLGFKGYLDWV